MKRIVERCQQYLQYGWRPYWQQSIVCGAAARYRWKSPLRGEVLLCKEHARQVGFKNCREIKR